MKINAILNKAITIEVATRLATEAAAIKPIYKVIAGDPDTVGARTAIDQQLDEGAHGDFAIYDYRPFEDGSFRLSLGYYSGMSKNIETIDVITDVDKKTGNCCLSLELHCETTRGAFQERIRPVLIAFGIHPVELEVREYKTTAGTHLGEELGKIMPWWATKGEFAFGLACGVVKNVDAAKQFGYAIELVHDAVYAEHKAQFVEDNYPQWVLRFRNSVEIISKVDSQYSIRCTRLIGAWDKFEQATKDLFCTAAEEFQKS